MKSHEVKISYENLLDAREDYLKYHSTLPEQLNAKFSEEDGWTIEFHEDESCWNEGFALGISGESVVTKILISCDQEDENILQLQSCWDDDWNDDKEINISCSTDEQKDEISRLTDKQRKKLKEIVEEQQEIYFDSSMGGCSALWTEEDLEEFPEEDHTNKGSVDFEEDGWLDSAIAYVKQ